MNEAIKLAIGAGYHPRYIFPGIPIRPGENYVIPVEELSVLDPLFWQALGKALGWKAEIKTFGWRSYVIKKNDWQSRAHQYFDLLWTGGDTEKFWKELLP